MASKSKPIPKMQKMKYTERAPIKPIPKYPVRLVRNPSSGHLEADPANFSEFARKAGVKPGPKRYPESYPKRGPKP